MKIAIPVIVLVLIVFGYVAFRIGKYYGTQASPLPQSQERSQLNHEAYKLINGLCIIDDINTDDLITDKTRRELNEWLNHYLRVEKRYP